MKLSECDRIYMIPLYYRAAREHIETIYYLELNTDKIFKLQSDGDTLIEYGKRK